MLFTLFLLSPIYLLVALYYSIKLSKHLNALKWTARAVLYFSLSLMPLIGDSVVGHAYHHYLAWKDGGVTVYQTVPLGAEHWNDDGSPKFYNKKGFNEDYFDGRYVMKNEYTPNNFGIGNIFEYKDYIKDESENKILGVKKTYVYSGGWLINSQIFDVGGTPLPKPVDYSVKRSSPPYSYFLSFCGLVFTKNKE